MSSPLFTSPSGAELSFQNAGGHLSRWLVAVGHTPAFQFHHSDDPVGTLCTLHLAYLGPLTSDPCPNKSLAKQSASFRAVKLLLDSHEVDDRFLPTPSKPRRRARDDIMATKSKCNYRWESRKLLITDELPQGNGSGEYAYQTTPQFWKECPAFAAGQPAYASVLLLSPTGEMTYDHPECRPMCLLTTRPLPFCEKYNTVEVNLGVGEQPTHRGCMKMIDAGPLESLDDVQLGQTLRFTERLMRAGLQRPIKADRHHIKWLLLPLKYGYRQLGPLAPQDIAWEHVEAIADGPLTIPFTFRNQDDLGAQCFDAMATANSEMARRSYITAIRQDLNPNSPHPEQPEKTILQVIQGETSTFPRLTQPNQPILQVETACLAKNGSCITTFTTPFAQRPKQYLIPEYENRHCIPASIFRTLTVFPFFIHQLECMLITYEMSTKLFRSLLHPELALQALTAPSSVNVTPWTYERLEILGDTLLKFFITIHVYLHGGGVNSREDSLKVWQDRHKLVSNRTLTANAIKLGLVDYVRDKRLKVKDWIPRDWELEVSTGQTVPKKAVQTSHDGPEIRRLGDKLLADIVEAIIGASYGMDKDFDNVISTLIRLNVPLDLFTTWDEIKHVLPSTDECVDTEEDGVDAGKMDSLSTFEVLGYKFKSKKRYNDVISMSNQPDAKRIRENYKMLGNAVLDLHVIELLLAKYPEEGPGSLSNMKTFRTTEGLRCALATELGLQDLLKDGDERAERELGRATYFMRDAKAQADAAGLSGDEQGGIHYWDNVAVNHFTGSVIEVIYGAIFQDSGFSLEHTQRIFDDHIVPFTEKYCKGPSATDLHPKGLLTRWMQAKGCAYWKLDAVGPKLCEGVVTCHDQDVARCKAFTTHMAVRNVCEEAIKRLRDENRIKDICDCPSFKEVIPEDKTFGKMR
ncbi:hypothetical protein I311_02190 [Cryptococcus gattii NT-10]|nr:hypothetical protein I311_02190 [Cryptococcus gattii NT-10]